MSIDYSQVKIIGSIHQPQKPIHTQPFNKSNGSTKSNKNNDDRVLKNAISTQQSIQKMWNEGYYNKFIENGSYKKNKKHKLKLKNIQKKFNFEQLLKKRYNVNITTNLYNENKIRNNFIKQKIIEEFKLENYKIIGDFSTFTKDYINYLCPRKHSSKIKLNDWRSGYRCKQCSKMVSKQETEVFDYCKSLFSDTIQSYRPSFLNKKEIDIFIPSKNFGIEYCGLFWHTIQWKNCKDHYDKFIKCRDNGLKLLTIFSDE